MKKLTIMSMIMFAVSVIIFGIFFVRERFLKDRTGPVFQLESGTITVSVKDDYSALLKGVTASDAADGDITGSITVEDISPFLEDGRRIITYAVADADGHVSHVKRTLLYSDYTPPKFHLDKPLRLPRNTACLPEGITAEDCIDGDVTPSVLILYERDFAQSGVEEFPATLKVTNSAGGTSYLPVDIEIYDSDNNGTAPELLITDYLVYINKDSAFDPKTYLKSAVIGGVNYTFTENSSVETPAGDETEQAQQMQQTAQTIDYSRVSIDSDVNVHAPGNYRVNYLLTDTEGGTGTGTARLYVVVTEGGSN